MTIKEIRALTCASQGKFAERYGIPVKTLQNWEIGRTKPPEYVLKLLERCVRMDMGEK